MGLIQTAEQLRFSYLSIIEGVQNLCLPLSFQNGTSSSDGDQSSNPEEVEEEDDVVSTGSPFYCQTGSEHSTSLDSNGQITVEEDEAPPPIPPRSESLASPGPGKSQFLALCFLFN